MAASARRHRMGDVGYFDEQGRLWFCGRKSQRVEAVSGPLYTEQSSRCSTRIPRCVALRWLALQNPVERARALRRIER